MPQTDRIVLCYPVQAGHIEQIHGSAAPESTVVYAPQEQVAEAILDADVFCGHAKVPVPWDEVVRRGRLRWIQSSAAGLDHCLVPSVIQSDIVVTSASGLFADQVAEHTMALLLGLLRSLPTFFEAQRNRQFVRRATGDLHGRDIGIVGFGGNGRRIAEVLAPFRNRIVATDVFPIDKPDYVHELWPADRLDDLLASVDIVILCVPLNESTQGMINSEKLSRMKEDSILVNVARGPIVIESDLVAALESRHLAAAALDVTEVEPLPDDSRLWSHSNVLITPHVAAQSSRRVDVTTKFFCENLRRYLTHETLLNEVDKKLGFPLPEKRAGANIDAILNRCETPDCD